MSGHYIELADGSRFHFGPEYSIAPEIGVIAHALSQLCRFTGHSAYVGGQIYSVAQHSVKVSYLVPRRYALAGLMHDAHECIIGDKSTPLKRYLAEVGIDFDGLDDAVARCVREAYDIPDPLPEPVKHADVLMCLIEATALMPTKARNWGEPLASFRTEALDLYIDRPELRPEPWTPEESKDRFLCRYLELKETQA